MPTYNFDILLGIANTHSNLVVCSAWRKSCVAACKRGKAFFCQPCGYPNQVLLRHPNFKKSLRKLFRKSLHANGLLQVSTERDHALVALAKLDERVTKTISNSMFTHTVSQAFHLNFGAGAAHAA